MPTPAIAPRLLELSAPALLWRRSKQWMLQANRLARWSATPERWPRPLLAPTHEKGVLLGSHTVNLERSDSDADPVLEAGKQHNVCLAAPAFDGLLLAPDRPLSFWRTLGRLTERKGYRHGLALSGGCLTPSIGGGICLLANALFEFAARQGWHILERWGHTMEAVPPPPGALWGMDATVAWPYVDLVMAPREGPVRLGARVSDGKLRLSIHGADAPRTRSRLWSEDESLLELPEGTLRINRVVRRVEDIGSGAVLEERTIAENRRRLLNPEARKRTCLTCGESACHARVEVPRVEARAP
ncbi:VanW family protein [Myxococcus sp. MxC21-1]|uniref:VanW family protein n=1 Tax=Myxococcus sp. MxC21-1 TaxID=3041439 RepID=UPI00292EAC55|nr:VanW family protein [Myxococcus sp. MxC21-1]WNZ59702.1 VanW family protein [Myxococcus sp. MxC21-1]